MSNADPPLLSAAGSCPALGRVPTFLAKAVLFKGTAGPVLRSLGASPVEAGGSDMEAYRVGQGGAGRGRRRHAHAGGHAQPRWAVLTAMPGVSLLATRTGATVLPVGISGTDELLGRGRNACRGSGRASRSASDDRSRSRSMETTGGPSLAAADAQVMRRIAALVDPRHRGDWEPWPDG